MIIITPHIYLAGKIAKNDWRHKVVRGLRGHESTDGPLDAGRFVYMGPFFRGCDHGCFHGEGTHGVMTPRQKTRELAQTQVRNTCFDQINACNVFIVYLNSREAYGSLVELGWAQILGKKIIVIFAPKIATPDKNDFWFGSSSVDRVIFDVAEDQLIEIINQVVSDFSLFASCGD